MWLLPTAARADAAATSSATAQALFDQGKKLMADGHVAEACPKLEESQRLDPASGTLVNLANCYEKAHRLASAWTKYLEAAVAAKASGNANREAVARERARAIAPRLSNLVIVVPDAVKDTPGLEITRGTEAVGPAQWGLPLPVDEGDYAVVARAPGHADFRLTATVKGEGTTTTVTLRPLAETADGPGAASPASPSDAEPAPSGGLGAQRTAALVAGGVGVVGVGLGTVFGLISRSKHAEAARYCDGPACTDDRGVEAGNGAHAAGNVATVAMVLGGIGLAAGVTLWFTAPASAAPSTSAALAVGPGALTLRGTF